MFCWVSVLTLTAEFQLSAKAALGGSQGNSLAIISFLLEAEWTPGLLNADRRNRSPENYLRTLKGIEPGTFRLVAQYPKQLHPSLHNEILSKIIIILCYITLYNII